MKRQKLRKLLLITAFLLFPITMWYFSPDIIILGAMERIINGSFITFSMMLFGSIFFGRFFCGYLCPAGGLQECAMLVNEKSLKQDWKNNIKYGIWFIWIVAIVVCFILSKNNVTINPFHMTDHGISISNISDYIIYYFVLLLLFIPSVLFGKRVACHYFCWMAPFMVIGTKVGNLLHIPQLHIKAEQDKCISCKQCNRKCPMSLDVEKMVSKGECSNAECILCGECVDICPKKVLRYSMENRGKNNGK